MHDILACLHLHASIDSYGSEIPIDHQYRDRDPSSLSFKRLHALKGGDRWPSAVEMLRARHPIKAH